MRRDKNDLEWKKVKKKVTMRDRGLCRFLRVCPAKDAIALYKIAPSNWVERLDHAHICPVSIYPELCYEEDNIVLLNRWSHHNLDDCKHPVTGKPITREERDEFWKRIVGTEVYTKLQEKIKGDRYGEEEESNSEFRTRTNG